MRTILLSHYGVLLKELPYEGFLRFMKESRPTADPTPFPALFRRAALGEISAEELMRPFGFNFPKAAGEDLLKNYLVFDKQFYGLAERGMRENARLVLCAEDLPEWNRYLRTVFRLDRFFSDVVVSGEEHLPLSDGQLLQKALERIGETPQNCTFVSASREELAAAARMGMAVKPFFRTAQTGLRTLPQLTESLFGTDVIWTKLPYPDPAWRVF